MTSQSRKCETFAALHRREGAFLIPNPFDVGSARVLQALGFPALATTSAGFAQTLGRADGQATLEEKIDHCARLAQATSIPINVDFEDGYARNLHEVGRNVLKIAATGSALASLALGPVIDAGREMLERGTFGWLAAMPSDLTFIQWPFCSVALACGSHHGLM